MKPKVGSRSHGGRRAGGQRNPVLALLAVGGVVGISVAASAGVLQPFLHWLHAVGGDKVGHFGLFAAMSAAVTWALGPSRWRAWALVLSAFALVDEGIQAFLPRRASSWADLAAGLAGIWLAAGLVGLGARNKPSERRA
ncbi:MAG: hypothetical protein GXO36_02225 [Chloroflexi bacterium]|nr:hypothetical protein [Chloroflexota bacterium]